MISLVAPSSNASQTRRMIAEYPEPEGGDPACWLNRVCPDCGRLNGELGGATCESCGAELPE